MRAFLLLLVFLAGCAGVEQKNHMDAPITQRGGTIAEAVPIEQQGNAVAVGQSRIALQSNESHGNVNEAAVIESGYRSMLVMVLAFSTVLVAGFAAVVLILIRGNQRHLREMLSK